MCMNLLMSDRPLPGIQMKEADRYIDLSRLKIRNCVGCFGCWVKTPGKCVIRDDAVTVYPLIAYSSRVIYVTRLYCGCYDLPMKTMLERAIPVQQAFIRLYHGQTHHIQREVKPKDAIIIAYGDAVPKEEQELFRRLVARNAHNMLFQSWRVIFAKEAELFSVVYREVCAWDA